MKKEEWQRRRNEEINARSLQLDPQTTTKGGVGSITVGGRGLPDQDFSSQEEAQQEGSQHLQGQVL